MIAASSRKALATRLGLAFLVVTAAAQSAWSQSVQTDKEDYTPGETALISASGFHADEAITLQVVHMAGGTPCTCSGTDHDPWTVYADSNGDVSASWLVGTEDSLGAIFMLTADCGHGLHAEYVFTDGIGTARIANVVGLGGACSQLTTIGVGPNAEQFWEVERNKSYIVTLTNVSECSGTTIEVVVHSGNLGDTCLTATNVAPSQYSFVFAMPADACRTFTISYCTNSCDPNTGKLARQPNGTNQFIGHLRTVRFGPNCTNPVLVGEFECCPDVQISCPSDITVCNDAGQCCAVVDYTVNVSGGCPPVDVVSNPPSGSCFPVGTTQVTAIATDVNGFTAQCSFNVTVNDCEDPVLTCPPVVTVCNDPGQCCAAVNLDSLVSATDNCGATLTIDPPSGTCFQVGTTPVTAIATDAAGHTSQCTFDVNVNDCEAPVVTCPADITVCNDATQCSAVVNFTTSATDNCPGVSSVCVPASGSTFPVGTTAVTCTATDAAGHISQCSFNVTVNDCEAPSITCPGDITVCNDAGQCAAEVNFTVTSSDNCPGVITVANPPSGSFFPLGTTVVSCTATDAAGHQTQCGFTVTVNDCESPTITCPGDMTVCNDPGQCSAVVNYTTTASDNCPGVNTICIPPPGASFPKGTTLVTCIATDAVGHTAQCTFNVTVNDCESPTIGCPGDLTVCNDANQCSAVVNFTVTAQDNCPGVSLVVTPPSGTTFPIGTTLVNAVATDVAGHVATCSFNVTVNDCQAPAISCPGDITLSAPYEFCSVIANYSATATDNCGTPNLQISPPSGSSFNVGTTIVTVTAMDSNGLTSQCQFNVIVYASAISGYVFYDINTDGVQDNGEVGLRGWKVMLSGGPSAPLQAYTTATGHYVFLNLLPGTYTVTQVPPPTGNWQATSPVNCQVNSFTMCPGTCNFGAVCLGAGGGLGLNYWNSDTGKHVLQLNDPAWRAILNAYCLRDLGGCAWQVPGGTFATAQGAFRNWLRNATTANAAYKLSTHFAALKLASSALIGLTPTQGVNGNALIFARNTASANAAGFATVNAVLNETANELCLHGCTPSCTNSTYVPVCGPVQCQFRVGQQALMAACDGANNNNSFVLPLPCKYQWNYP
jgi:hypothetical protein